MKIVELENIDQNCLHSIDQQKLFDVSNSDHKPRILLLHGSLRERSFSRMANEEAARILQAWVQKPKPSTPPACHFQVMPTTSTQKFRSSVNLPSGAKVWFGAALKDTAP